MEQSCLVLRVKRRAHTQYAIPNTNTQNPQNETKTQNALKLKFSLDLS